MPNSDSRLFIVWEAQETTRTSIWRHHVHASTLEEAMEKAKNGNSYVIDDFGHIGDEDFGTSGWGTTRDAAIEDHINRISNPGGPPDA